MKSLEHPEGTPPVTEEELDFTLQKLVSEGKIIAEVQPDKSVRYFERLHYLNRVQQN